MQHVYPGGPTGSFENPAGPSEPALHAPEIDDGMGDDLIQAELEGGVVVMRAPAGRGLVALGNSAGQLLLADPRAGQSRVVLLVQCRLQTCVQPKQ